MARRDETQVERILEEIYFIEKFTFGIDITSFLENDLIQHGVTMSLITIGECSNHLSESFKEYHHEVEWHKIIAVRNIAAHGYWQLNMKQIWQAISVDIPILKNYLEQL